MFIIITCALDRPSDTSLRMVEYKLLRRASTRTECGPDSSSSVASVCSASLSELTAACSTGSQSREERGYMPAAGICQSPRGSGGQTSCKREWEH
eukprot:7667045-Pyramimonas_sp.AAC.1